MSRGSAHTGGSVPAHTLGQWCRGCHCSSQAGSAGSWVGCGESCLIENDWERGAPRTLEAVFALEGDSRGMRFRCSQEDCGWWGGTARHLPPPQRKQLLFHRFQTLPASPAALIADGVLEMLGSSCTVALSAACSCRKTSKGQCLARSSNWDVRLQPPEARGPLSPSHSQHSDPCHLL